MEETKTRKWRWGVNRWLVLLFAILTAVSVNYFFPVRPHIQVAAEAVSKKPLFSLGGDVYLTNTMLAMLVMDAIILALALAVRSFAKGGSLVPKGIYGAVEALMEALYNLTESSAGKWTKRIFPYFAAITLVVLVANWSKLLPGYETIGLLHHSDHGNPVQEILPGVYSLVQGDGHTETHDGYALIGFLRGLPTDLNFTVALALFSVFMTQVIGVRAQGLGYFLKFLNVRTLFSKPGFGAIDLAVGLLELISELAKILSFAFRLFGNMFAGLVLLILIGTMLPTFLPSGIYLFEFFIGLIQAFVFGMLTMVFMAQATVGHGGEEHS